MNARHGQVKVCDEDRLPIFHRTIRLPAELWRAVKARGQQDGKAIRWVIDDALDSTITLTMNVCTHTLRTADIEAKGQLLDLSQRPASRNSKGAV